MGKIPGKGKHTVKAGNHAYTDVISKPATVRREQYKFRKWELYLNNLKQSCVINIQTALSKPHAKYKLKKSYGTNTQ